MSHVFNSGKIAASVSIDELIVHAWRSAPWLAAGLTDDVSAWERVRLRGRESGLTLEATIDHGVWLVAVPEQLLEESIQFTAFGEKGRVIADLALGILGDWCRGEDLDHATPAPAPDLVA